MVKMLYNRFTGIYKFGNNTYPRRIRRRSNLDHIFLGKKMCLMGQEIRYLQFIYLMWRMWLTTLGGHVMIWNTYWESYTFQVPVPQFSNMSESKSQVHRCRTDITLVSVPHRAAGVIIDRGNHLSNLQHCGNCSVILLQQLDSHCIMTLSSVKNSEDSKKKCVGETRGPQEERTDERYTKKSSCNPVMGYDAKHRV